MSNNATENLTHKLYQWHFIAKIALVLAAVTCLGAVLVLHFITGDMGQNYADIARYFSSSRKNIGPTMLVAGLILVSFTSLITWMMALYASFYIAGPLFRFARNLETLIEQGPTSLIPTRKTDRLKNEEQQMKRSVEKLQMHYGKMRTIVEEMLAQPDFPAAASITRLKELDREVRL